MDLDDFRLSPQILLCAASRKMQPKGLGRNSQCPACEDLPKQKHLECLLLQEDQCPEVEDDR